MPFAIFSSVLWINIPRTINDIMQRVKMPQTNYINNLFTCSHEWQSLRGWAAVFCLVSPKQKNKIAMARSNGNARETTISFSKQFTCCVHLLVSLWHVHFDNGSSESIAIICNHMLLETCLVQGSWHQQICELAYQKSLSNNYVKWSKRSCFKSKNIVWQH